MKDINNNIIYIRSLIIPIPSFTIWWQYTKYNNIKWISMKKN